MMHPYARHAYAQSLSHWAEPQWIEPWQTSVMLREIDGGGIDAAGVYPLTALSDQADLAAGLQQLKALGCVSFVGALDDFHRPEPQKLDPFFTHRVTFKTHYIHNPQYPQKTYPTLHRRKLRKAEAEGVTVARMKLADHVDEWDALYAYLTQRLGLSGLHAFPSAHSQYLASTGEFITFGAWQEGQLVSAHIWAQNEQHLHSHLTASSEIGYQSGAAYLVNNTIVSEYGDTHRINFGGGAGYQDDTNDGLARFKRGFANDVANSYIYGTILDERRYAELVDTHGKGSTNFFPAYRAPKSS